MVSESFASLFGWVVRFKRTIRIEPMLPLLHLRHIALFLVPWSTRVPPVFKGFANYFQCFLPSRRLCDRGCLQPHAVWRMVLACCPWRVCARLNQDQVLVTLYTERVKRQDSEFQDVSSPQHPDRYKVIATMNNSTIVTTVNMRLADVLLDQANPSLLKFWSTCPVSNDIFTNKTVNHRSRVYSVCHLRLIFGQLWPDLLRCISFNVAVACAILLATLDSYGFLQASLSSSEVPMVGQCCTNINWYRLRQRHCPESWEIPDEDQEKHEKNWKIYMKTLFQFNSCSGLGSPDMFLWLAG